MKLKYRIKVVTHKNDSKLYYAQVKKGFRWLGISFDGKARSIEYECATRADAVNRIDKHHKGNRKVEDTYYEYITISKSNN